MQNLTNAQLATLKAWLVVNANSLNDAEAANALNVQASPSFIVWRTDVMAQEVDEAVDWDEIVGFGTSPTTTNDILKGLAKLTAWQSYRARAVFNFGKASTRQAFIALFGPVGNPVAPDSFSGLTAIGKRSATIAEKLLASGTGDTANPATMGVNAEDLVTTQNVVDARSLPS